jgi:hypothetical protein
MTRQFRRSEANQEGGRRPGEGRFLGSLHLQLWTRIGAINREAFGSPHLCGRNVAPRTTLRAHHATLMFPRLCRINAAILARFMESLHDPAVAHWDHELGGVPLLAPASWSAAALCRFRGVTGSLGTFVTTNRAKSAWPKRDRSPALHDAGARIGGPTLCHFVTLLFHPQFSRKVEQQSNQVTKGKRKQRRRRESARLCAAALCRFPARQFVGLGEPGMAAGRSENPRGLAHSKTWRHFGRFMDRVRSG